MKKVIIYTTPACPYCQMAKEFFKENNIEFVEYDVSQDIKKAQEMIDKSGQIGVPVIDIEGEIVIGFDKPRLIKLLNLS